MDSQKDLVKKMPLPELQSFIDDYTVRNVCNFSIQGYIKFPICLLNLLDLVILVYSGILNFFCEVICILNLLSVH